MAYALVSLVVLPACALSQLAGALLDRVCFEDRNTMGYIMVARKGNGTD